MVSMSLVPLAELKANCNAKSCIVCFFFLSIFLSFFLLPLPRGRFCIFDMSCSPQVFSRFRAGKLLTVSQTTSHVVWLQGDKPNPGRGFVLVESGRKMESALNNTASDTKAGWEGGGSKNWRSVLKEKEKIVAIEGRFPAFRHECTGNRTLFQTAINSQILLLDDNHRVT